MRLITKGIKGVDHELELGRLTLLTGPNGSGKSTAADSLRFLALGFVPALGKRPVDTAALMANGSMSVELALEDGRAIRRGLERTDNGFTQVAEASWIRNGKPKEIGQAITGLFGTEEQDVAECLDIRELLAATPNQRTARIQQLLTADKRSPEETAKAVARWTVMRLADTDEERMPDNYLDALPMVPKRQVAILQEAAPMVLGKIKDAGLEGGIHWANEEKRTAATGLQKKEGAAYELRKRAAQVPEPDAKDIERLEAERARIQKELGILQERASNWGRLTAQKQQLGAALDQVKEMAARTNQIVQDAEAVHGKRIQEIQEKLDQVKKATDLMEAPQPLDDSKAAALAREEEELRKKAETFAQHPMPSDQEERGQIDTLTERLKAAKASEWSRVLEIAETIETKVASAKGAKTALAAPLKELRDLARRGMGVNPEEIEHQLDAWRIKLAAVQKAIDKTVLANKNALSTREELLAKAKDKRTQAAALREEKRLKEADALNAYNTTRRKLLSERENYEAAISTNRHSLETARSEKAMVERRLASLQDQLAGTPDPGVQPEGLEGLQAKGRATADVLRVMVENQGLHREIQRAIDEIEDAKASREVYSAIEWAFLRQREVEVSESGGKLLRFMTDFLEGAGRKEVPFIRAAAGLCTIGWKTDTGKEIQVQALSGGEWCVFAAALTSAVLLARSSALKVLLVEAGETDERHLQQLLAGARQVAHDGIGLQAVLVMTPRAPASTPKGWQVVMTAELART